PDRRRHQQHEKTVRQSDATGESKQEGKDATGFDRLAEQRERNDHQPAAQENVGHGRPVDIPAGNQKLLVDRPEQVKVKIAAADQLGERVAVIEKQRFDDAAESVKAADEEEVLELAPFRDELRLLEDDLIEEQQYAEPDHLHRNAGDKVAAKRHLA